MRSILDSNGKSIFKLPVGWFILAARPYTSHPDDEYLTLVLLHNPDKKEFVTWVYNHQSGGPTDGRYFTRWESAFGDFLNRRVDYVNMAAVRGLVDACDALIEFWDNDNPVQAAALQVEDFRKALAEVKRLAK
jgi:hypothetical protein